MELEYTDSYKYLGFMQNTHNNVKNHIQTLKREPEASYQRILALAFNTAFKT